MGFFILAKDTLLHHDLFRYFPCPPLPPSFPVKGILFHHYSEASLPLFFLYLPLNLCPCPSVFGDLSYLFLFILQAGFSFATLYISYKGYCSIILCNCSLCFLLNFLLKGFLTFIVICRFVSLCPSLICYAVGAIGFQFPPSRCLKRSFGVDVGVIPFQSV